MRLIDADALECDSEWSEYADDYVSYSKTEIDNAPTIDAVQVVRCKDCKWWTKQEASIQGRCALAGIYPTGGWYCGNGKREDNE